MKMATISLVITGNAMMKIWAVIEFLNLSDVQKIKGKLAQKPKGRFQRFYLEIFGNLQEKLLYVHLGSILEEKSAHVNRNSGEH